MRKLELIVRKFLQERGYLDQPLLLALSGGPDSKALFHCLLKLSIHFEVAHVDHRWRPSSQKEAEELAILCDLCQIPFHLKTLDIPDSRSNLEELCRQERLSFFKSLIFSKGYAALLTAHHADDQAETVLKRVLEGASLHKLSALLPEKKMGSEMIIVRPFLDVSKTEILEWLHFHQIPFFVDSSNKDSRFLRARMREELIPTLSRHFGKNIQKGLCHLAERAVALDRFLEEHLNPILAMIEKEAGRNSLSFPEECIRSSFLLEEGLKRFFEQCNISIPNSMLKRYVGYLQTVKKIKVENYRGSRIEFTRGAVTLFLN